MPDQDVLVKISGLPALDGKPALGDLFPIVDVSDPTEAASGTTKKVAASVLGLTRKIYRAKVTGQDGVHVGEDTVFENTTGLDTSGLWDIDDVGQYYFGNGAPATFDPSKTFVQVVGGAALLSVSVAGSISINFAADTTFYIEVEIYP